MESKKTDWLEYNNWNDYLLLLFSKLMQSEEYCKIYQWEDGLLSNSPMADRICKWRNLFLGILEELYAKGNTKYIYSEIALLNHSMKANLYINF